MTDNIRNKRRRDKRRLENMRFCKLCCNAYYLTREPNCGSSRYCKDCSIMDRTCGRCGELFQMKRVDVDRGRGKYCSLTCSGKLSSFKKGENHPNWRGGDTLDRKSYAKSHREANRGKYAHYARIRQYRKKNAEGSHTENDWITLKEMCGNACVCCGKKESQVKITVDHIVPLSRGGSNDIKNIQPLCVSCNSKKRTRIINYIESYGLQR